jgi:hypothetical protein
MGSLRAANGSRSPPDTLAPRKVTVYRRVAPWLRLEVQLNRPRANTC